MADSGSLSRSNTMKKSRNFGTMSVASSARRQDEAGAGGLAHQETIKERQNRYKTEREDRTSRLNKMTDYLISIAADYFDMDKEEATNFILDSESQVALLEKFISKENSCKSILFYYHLDKTPGMDAGRIYPKTETGKVMRLTITDGKTLTLTESAVYFTKSKIDLALTLRNISEETNYGILDPKKEGSLLLAVRATLANIYTPALDNYCNWGKLDDTPEGKNQQLRFMASLDVNVNYLEKADKHTQNVVFLKPGPPQEFLDQINLPGKQRDMAARPEKLKFIEDLVSSTWCRQMEQVLAESDQMRKEAHDTGPIAELEHWRSLSVKFNFLLEQIKSERVRWSIQMLAFGKSKLLKSWLDFEGRITDNANEAKDNVKFLSSLEQVCMPLYCPNPGPMMECIPNLINVVTNIHNISRYYNTSQRLTSLYVKVTNQMVNSLRKYMTDNGKNLIWEQSSDELLARIDKVDALSECYKKNFQVAKQILQEAAIEAGTIDFELSEMYIFGKLDYFSKRLHKIGQIINTIEQYDILTTTKIEGIKPVSDKFQAVINTARNKPYDVLDTRKTEFDKDYQIFIDQMRKVEQEMVSFMDSCFAKVQHTDATIALITRFANLDLPFLHKYILDKYSHTLTNYVKDQEYLKKLYLTQKDDPPYPNNTPDLAGKLMWCRQLLRKLIDPLQLLEKKCKELVETKEAKKIIRNTNSLALVLMEYEMIQTRKWETSVEYVKQCLHSNLLTRQSNGTLTVNWDNKIAEVASEVKIMQRLRVNIPDLAIEINKNIGYYKATKERLTNIITKFDKLRLSVPQIFQEIMEHHINEVDAALRDGVLYVMWSSLNHNVFFQEVENKLNNFELILKKVIDIKEARIDAGLKNISEEFLILLPDEPITLTKFIELTTDLDAKAGNLLSKMSEKVRTAVLELIKFLATESNMMSKLTEKPITPEVENFKIFIDTIFQHYREKLRDALVKCIKFNLDLIRKRVFFRNTKPGDMELTSTNTVQIPLFQANINLEIPNIVILPSLEDFQSALNTLCNNLLNATKLVMKWSKPEWAQIATAKPSSNSLFQDNNTVEIKDDLKDQPNYFKPISDNKDIAKLVLMVASSCNAVRQPINDHLVQYNNFKELWADDRQDQVTKFKNSEPLLTDWKAKIVYYDHLSGTIDELQSVNVIGPFDLDASNVKASLNIESRNWKIQLSRALNSEYAIKMKEMITFFDEQSHMLSRNVQDLDDVRHVMGSLAAIRHKTLDIDNQLGPIEEAYSMLNKFEIDVDPEEANQVDTLRYTWNKVQAKEKEMQQHLIEVQAPYHIDLVNKISDFQTATVTFENNYDTEGPMAEGITPQEASDRLAIYQTKFEDLWRKFQTYSAGETLFGLDNTDYPMLHRIKKELGLLQKLYSLYNAVMDNINGYYDILWVDVDIESIRGEINDFQNRCRKLPKGLKEWQAYIDLSKKIDDFDECCPLLELMSNKAMLKRHWVRIENLTKYTFEVEDESFLLRNIMEAPLLENKEDIEDICISASKEKDIEQKLNAVIAEWQAQVLYFSTFKSRGELLLKGQETSDTVALMEDSLMVLSSLMSNRYNAPFKKNIQSWVQKLSNTTDIIEQWLVVQNLWVYLEAVFVGGDIAKQLPQEAKRFSQIDKTWVKIMTRAHENTNVVQCCVGDETMAQLLPHLLEQLEQCQKSLTGYLEQKRLVFPRFFFISDPALLEILGQASDSHTIQSHLLGIFENVAKVQFHEKEYNKICAFSSKEGETVMLEKPVMAQGNVELWLGDLLVNQQKSLHAVIRNAFNTVMEPGSYELIPWLAEQPAQVGLLGIQMLWTYAAEEALKTRGSEHKKAMKGANEKFQNILNQLINQCTQELSKYDRTKFETLVTIHVHQRDIFDELLKTNCKTPQEFDWLKQARFYFDQDNDKTLVSITDVNFIYQNEFIGCTDRLCVTPLTDRCYITLAQALGMSMGGAPAGPAGTGKTETTKDMARCLGKYCVVFNCSDQMDFRGLGRIYKGLAQSGSWGCFDEFNRIDLPVLSVAAQQIYIVLQARKEKKSHFIFTDGDNVSLNPEFGLFITMNPGYAGRQELPENLKVQFRSVAMMVPDRQIIKRVKLASCGFRENEILAAKFFTLYKLCEEQLTKQVHYDFGLRNILSVLRTLGTVKRSRPEDSEANIVMRVLRDMNLSKLVDEDEPLFMSLINDLFPGMVLEVVTYDDLNAAMNIHIDKLGLIPYPAWSLKVVQLFETQNVRHGMMTLGPSGAGKTCCIRTLHKCLTEMGKPHKEVRMNPKAITAPQMFGRLDVATNDWTDGIFSTLWRRTHKTKKGDNCWLILDGPVDAVWIENLNSVLDDNKTLTLANGDRIPMAPNCKILFEVHNIDNASPATVSRNGMVFMSSSILGWRPLIDGWLLTRKPMERESINKYVSGIFNDSYTYVIQSLNPKMVLLECNYVRQFTDLMDGLLTGEDEEVQSESHICKLVVFALMWSLGGVLELDEREKLQTKFFEINQTLEDKLTFPTIKEGENIFEYLVGKAGDWIHWDSQVETYEYPKEGEVPVYADILIPNVDNIRTNFLIDSISKQAKGVLLIGEQGTGKTVMIKGYLNKLNPESHMNKAFNFSSATEPGMFQRTIESYVDKRMGSTYGPPAGRKMTVFVDDINMPIINEWGDQITNEIVRQMMEWNGMYSLEKPGDFTTIVDIQFIAAMIHPGGGRNDIPERLKRQFSVFNCSLPSNNSIDKIFGTVANWFSAERGFPSEVCSLIPKLVPASRILWQWTKIKMLPTPAKFHYIFNLRDLSRVWEGMLHIQPAECQSEQTVLNLWTNEMQRVISDRFTSSEDQDWFNENVVKCIRENVREDLAENVNVESLFVDFLREAPEPTGEEDDDADFDAPKIYEEVPSLDELKKRLGEYMVQYNEVVRGSGMDIVFFKDAMLHLCRVSRIIRTPRGAAMLVGVGGSGKQSMTKLASFIAGYKVFQITLTRTYNSSNLMDDLKYLYKEAGEKGNGMTFIFTDNDIKEEGFLEYLNNVLSSGEVSGLFAKDEIDEITQNLIPVMKAEFPRRPPTAENLYQYFISRARDNLHVVLCFSPVSAQFRTRALKFPGIFSGCTMDWYTKWPQDALVAVSGHFLEKFPMVCTPEIKENVVKVMGQIHHQVGQTCIEYFDRFRRTTHVTPKSYLSFLQGFLAIYKEKHEHLANLESRMNTGLDKLLEAGESVAKLSEELVVKEKELAVASAKADVVLAEVTVSAEAAQKVKAAVLVVKNKAQTLVDDINADKAVAEGKLAAAAPALEAAEAALNTIKAADIATVRKLAKPPHLIMRIMDAVLILFGKKVDKVENDPDPDRPYNKPSWASSLQLMAQGHNGMNFLAALQNFDKDTINDEVVELLEENYFKHPDYTLETAKKVCGNVAGLVSWTLAMTSFYAVNKEVLPLKANLAKQEIKLAAAEEELAAAQKELDAKQAELDIVQAKFDKAMGEKQALLDDAESCRRRMTAATQLIEGLGGEKVRWTAQSKMFAEQIRKLVGDVILATGFLSYCGPFNQEFRTYLIKKCWETELKKKDIPYTEGLDLIEMLTDSAQIGEWNLEGLPSDDLSVQNAIIVTKASRYPLLVDPQGQAKQWIKKKENKNPDCKLQVTTLNNKYFRTHLEDSLSLGNPLLIEDVAEDLDPALDNVLEKNFIKSGSTFKVKVGDKECEVMSGFKLYITTKLPNPKYTPEVSARTSIIDFTVTAKGLEDQLLGRVILAEKAELESERVKLMEEVTANKRKMKELEDGLLFKLTSTKGSLVDDESLIVMLANTKETSAEVSQQLAVAAETNIKINQAREEFRPIAERGSILYFVICDMSMVNMMYQTSLGQFLTLFDYGMSGSVKSPITAKRINNIIEFLNLEVFKYTCRGLYENDKLLFTLLMTLKIDIRKNNVRHPEFQTFIKGGAALDLKSCPAKPAKWILDMTWLNLVQLSKLPEFRQILEQVGRNEKQWKQWFDSEAPEEEQIPDGYSSSLDTFRKLLLVRSWCPDRTIPQAKKYIADSMGDIYAEAVILDLDIMLAESDIRTPMICLLSMGSDPTDQICGFAKKQKLECRCISMGQGQEVHARRLITMSMQNGGWVLLQNCHLGLNFMDELLETLTTADEKQVNDSFRVWITTEPHPLFSITMLQSSIKFTNEPPQGVKAGLKRTFAGYSQEMLDISNMAQWKPLLYAVAFLHTTVQERRKFGPLGWNIPYEFNSSDQTATVQFIQNHLDDLDPKRGIQWQTVRYMIGEVQYGGRVTDDFDKKLLNAFSKSWFGEEMFSDKFCFFKDYPIHKYKTTTEIMEIIENMPLIDSPEVYGLHPNADITYQTNTAKDILDMIVNIQPKDGGGGGGETREAVVYRQADEMLSKLPDDYIPHEVRARLKKMGPQNPLNIFLKQEIDRMQKVISLVRMTLQDLKLAIDGTIIMSEDLKDALDNIFDARVPAKWKKISWASTTIGFWFTELLERNTQFRTWIFDGRPACFWMTGFFNPQGFLTAMRQEVTRMHKGWALDAVVLHNEVTTKFKDDITAPPAEGVYVQGLFLDGAAWDRKGIRLIESSPKVLFVPLPVVWIYAINKQSSNTAALYRDMYSCPVYKKPIRTDQTFITTLWLKCGGFKDTFWTMRGVALLEDIK